MGKERTLREIMQLPELERDKEPRQAQGVVLSWRQRLIGLGVVLVVAAALFAASQLLYVSVPNVTGTSSDLAEMRLKQAGLDEPIIERRFSTAEDGSVIEQSPRAGQRARKGSKVTLIVSGGTEEVVVPDVIGDNEVYATRVLTQKGLVPVIVEEPSTKQEGTVLSLLPVVGEKVVTGDTITVRVAGSRQQVSLKSFNLKGKRIVIKPYYAQDMPSDVTYDIARRLSALGKAAGAEVEIARAAGSTKLTSASRSSADAIITLSTRAKSSNGIEVRASADAQLSLRSNTASLGSAVFKQLSDNTVNVRQGSISKSSSAPLRSVTVSIGSTSNASDRALMQDPQYKDLIAQSIYMGIGLYLTR